MTWAFIRGMLYWVVICIVIGWLFILWRRLFSITNIETALTVIGAICIVLGCWFSEWDSEIEKYNPKEDD